MPLRMLQERYGKADRVPLDAAREAMLALPAREERGGAGVAYEVPEWTDELEQLHQRLVLARAQIKSAVVLPWETRDNSMYAPDREASRELERARQSFDAAYAQSINRAGSRFPVG